MRYQRYKKPCKNRNSFNYSCPVATCEIIILKLCFRDVHQENIFLKKRMSCKFHIISSGQIICVIYRISTFKIFYKILVGFKITFKVDFSDLGFRSFSGPHLFIILLESIFFFFRNFRFSHFIFTSCSMCSACQFLLRACKHI